MANMQERLEASVSQAEIDVSKLHDIINGNDSATIETENGLVSSIAKHLKDIRLEILQGMETTIDTAESNLDKLHQIINGDENTTVETDNGPISSIAKHLKEIRAELTQGVDEIVGTALSAKEIILEAQSDITTKYEEIQTIRSNLDEIVTNITAINERFVNSIDEFEITLNEAITSINDTKDSGIEAVNVQLNTEKEALVAELNQETNDEIKRVQTEGQKQINLAIAQADRAKNEANAVNHPLTTRTETGGTINIDWNINQDYLFNIASDTTFSFSNLPQNDEKGNFIQLIINATAAIKPVFPQNCVFAEDNSPDFVAGKTYQVMLQYIASLSKCQVAFVEY